MLWKTKLSARFLGILLARPAFAQAAEASFLNQEAGIAAYVNVGRSLDLAKARTAFRTIEKETTSYIVGSVALPDYPVSEDIHCYVHKDGWIVAYYLRDEPTSKIVDWKNYSPGKISTKLELGLTLTGNSLGLAPTNVRYYHFGYPDANKLMVVADALHQKGSETFTLKLPSEMVFFERSFSHFTRGASGNPYTRKESKVYVNEAQISLLGNMGTNYGLLTPSDLRPNETHIINLTADAAIGEWWTSGATSYPAFASIVLVYREP